MTSWRAFVGICLMAAGLTLQAETELHFCIGAQPKTLNPLLVDDDASETIRYLTEGVLARLNRRTQQLEPALATSWTVSRGGAAITFQLRQGVRFSDGTPFSAEDVAYTVHQLMDPALHSPTGDAFGSGREAVRTQVTGDRINIQFSHPIVGVDRLFDQVAILSARSRLREMAVLGPYFVAENHAGAYLVLKRNPYYWKRDEQGRQLPYIDSIRLDVQQNRDLELMRLLRGEIDLVNALSPENFERVAARFPRMAMNAGVSLDSEEIWFNQVPAAPIPDYKKAWFRTTKFRQALSAAIRRDDLARIVYRGHAQPAISWISPANRFWFNTRLQPHRFDPKGALRLLQEEGFRLRDGILRDSTGHVVEFSVLTNAGNRERERMAALIQQDWKAIGIRLNIVTPDFPSLIERIMHTFNYEACLLGMVNDELDPNAQINVWLSSAQNHQWNPNQKAPATAWEAEIDRLMLAQASTFDAQRRKQLVDRVQEIVWEQEPFLYLVNKDALIAIGPRVQRGAPVALRPQAYWNIDQLMVSAEVARSK